MDDDDQSMMVVVVVVVVIVEGMTLNDELCHKSSRVFCNKSQERLYTTSSSWWPGHERSGASF